MIDFTIRGVRVRISRVRRWCKGSGKPILLFTFGSRHYQTSNPIHGCFYCGRRLGEIKKSPHGVAYKHKVKA